MPIKLHILFFLSVFILHCCSSDYTENLGGDYFFRGEGGLLNDIHCRKANGGVIPATVLDYDYDNEFIIAKQKPKIPQDPLYEKEYIYKNGCDKVYYWLIIKRDNFVLGPFDFEEFKLVRNKYKVSDNLKLE